MRIVVVLLLVLIAILQVLWHTDAIAVMSVDLGSEWMKVAIVSPGVPMEIALNKESKRKTPVTIAFRDGERTFGEDAQVVGVRFPRNSYSYLPDLLGKTVDNPLVQLYQKRFPYYDIEADPERGTVLFRHDSSTTYSPEELLGQVLQQARVMASTSAAQPVKEAVITVPGFFNQAERRALLQAAELAGLKVLQLINDYTAVALNYGIFRRKDFNETATYILFYDMGASSTTATVVSYQLVKTKEKGFVETNPQLSVLGVGYDRTLGGLEMQLRLRDYLARKFDEQGKTQNSVFNSPRALAKLFKEAGRLKNVLSANAEHYAQVEGLLDDVDFKLLVTREQFEEICADLFDRIPRPLEQALKTSGLDIGIISQVILVGAGTRVPKVQEKLAATAGLELGKSLNTDEAAAMGAVYKAADLSSGFKVKKFLTKDAVLFPIQVQFERELESGGGTKQVRRLLFGPMNPYPQKKVLTFNKHHVTDFSFNIGYGELDHLPQHEIQALGPLNLSQVELTGVAEALAKHRDSPGVESKGVKAHFTTDDSGLLLLSGVELVLEKTVTPEEEQASEGTLSKIGSTISKLFAGSDDKEDTKEQVKEEAKKDGEKTDSEGKEDESEESKEQKESSKESDDKQTNAEDKTAGEKKGKEENTSKTEKTEEEKNATKPVDKKPKIVTLKETITAVEMKSGVRALNEEQFQASLKKLKELNEFDEQRKRRESALNSLESFVFDAQTKIYAKEYLAASTEEELEKIKEMCSQVSDWLYEDGAEADAQAYEEKLSQLKQVTRELYIRVREHQERPGALAALAEMIDMSERFLVGARNGSAEIFTAVELDTLEKAITDTKAWKTKMEEEQSQQKLSEMPKLTIKSISEKMNLLDREVKYLINKAKIWKPKKKDEPKEKEGGGEGKNTTSGSEEAAKDKEQVEQPEPVTGTPTEEPELSSPSPSVDGASEVPLPAGAEQRPDVAEGKEEEASHSEL